MSATSNNRRFKERNYFHIRVGKNHVVPFLLILHDHRSFNELMFGVELMLAIQSILTNHLTTHGLGSISIEDGQQVHQRPKLYCLTSLSYTYKFTPTFPRYSVVLRTKQLNNSVNREKRVIYLAGNTVIDESEIKTKDVDNNKKKNKNSKDVNEDVEITISTDEENEEIEIQDDNYEENDEEDEEIDLEEVYTGDPYNKPKKGKKRTSRGNTRSSTDSSSSKKNAKSKKQIVADDIIDLDEKVDRSSTSRLVASEIIDLDEKLFEREEINIEETTTTITTIIDDNDNVNNNDSDQPVESLKEYDGGLYQGLSITGHTLLVETFPRSNYVNINNEYSSQSSTSSKASTSSSNSSKSTSKKSKKSSTTNNSTISSYFGPPSNKKKK